MTDANRRGLATGPGTTAREGRKRGVVKIEFQIPANVPMRLGVCRTTLAVVKLDTESHALAISVEPEKGREEAHDEPGVNVQYRLVAVERQSQ